jgi:hypothetical protein
VGNLKDELMAIREKRGMLTPRIVFEEAKRKNHPLHDKVFDVEPKEAAERYYIANAARLLRVTFRTTVDDRPADLREFWAVKGTPESPETQYVPMEEIIQDPISRQVMLQQMMRDWNRFKGRYKVYSEFIQLVLNDPDLTGVDPDEEFGANGSEG